MSVIEGRFDPVQLAQLGGAAAALEAALATVDGEVLVLGWLHAPEDDGAALSCEIDGEQRPLELLARTARPDVFDMLSRSGPGAVLETGFAALARFEPEQLARGGGRIALVLTHGEERAVSTNRLQLQSQTDLTALVGAALPLRALRPEALARVADGLLASRGRGHPLEALRSLEHQDLGPRREPELSVVIPVNRNLPTLRETLSYLDMDPEAGRLEVVLVATEPSYWTALEAETLGAAAELRCRLVRSARSLPVSVATRVGLELATAPHVVLMADAVCPPAPGWISDLLEDLQALDYGAPAFMPRFDGLPHRFEPRTPPPGAFAFSHGALRSDLLRSMAELGVDVRSPAVFAARRSALLEAEIAWSGFATEEAFWAHLLNEGVRRGLASLRAGERFTYAPLEPAPAHQIEQELLDAYLLDANFRRWTERLRPVEAAEAV